MEIFHFRNLEVIRVRAALKHHTQMRNIFIDDLFTISVDIPKI